MSNPLTWRRQDLWSVLQIEVLLLLFGLTSSSLIKDPVKQTSEVISGFSDLQCAFYFWVAALWAADWGSHYAGGGVQLCPGAPRKQKEMLSLEGSDIDRALHLLCVTHLHQKFSARGKLTLLLPLPPPLALYLSLCCSGALLDFPWSWIVLFQRVLLRVERRSGFSNTAASALVSALVPPFSFFFLFSINTSTSAICLCSVTTQPSVLGFGTCFTSNLILQFGSITSWRKTWNKT